MQSALLYIGAAVPVVWGVAHLFPTKNVVAGFGDISDDNRNIITMEWIIEGVSMIFMGCLLAVVTAVDANAIVSKAVYGVSVLGLLALSLVAFFTGFKVRFLPFRLCPFILISSAVLVCAGLIL